MDLFKEAEEIKETLYAIRRYLHQHPELGTKEFVTSAYVESILKREGIKTIKTSNTGLIGIINEGKTPVIALRSDMDALPIKECSNYAYASLNDGIMHACGHDIHMASLLGAALILVKHKDEINGSIKLIFESDEEGDGQALQLIKDGYLNDCEAVFGAHVDPNIPLGSIGIRYGKFYAAADGFFVKIKGLSAHGAMPEKGRDALVCGAEMVYRLSLLPEQFKDKTVLTTGILNSGTAINIISDECDFSGMIRTLGKEDREKMKSLFMETCHKIADKWGCEVSIDYIESYSGVVNDEKCTNLVRKCAETLYPGRVIEIKEPTMTTEDFGYYIEKCTGSFYHVGTGKDKPLHNSKFLPEEETILYACTLHASIVMHYFASK